MSTSGPSTQDDIIVEVARQRNVRFNDLPELKELVVEALDECLELGFIQKNRGKYMLTLLKKKKIGSSASPSTAVTKTTTAPTLAQAKEKETTLGNVPSSHVDREERSRRRTQSQVSRRSRRLSTKSVAPSRKRARSLSLGLPSKRKAKSQLMMTTGTSTERLHECVVCGGWHQEKILLGDTPQLDTQLIAEGKSVQRGGAGEPESKT
ncbi:uncharacterized protein LOC115633908 isoform X2 [Scaptodrosophila lebanonensis]|nr:uncharacterized protein LOC115633908 isoform X2 [Scaptodrosophila lebanonensis]